MGMSLVVLFIIEKKKNPGNNPNTAKEEWRNKPR